MSNLNAIEENTGRSRTLTADIENAVRAELEAMLKTPIFAQSGRCKRFLSYVVSQTLEGNGSQLKERTIGISVFERANDYDTGDDSIVRVTANEVRKRIGQFYRESGAAHSIQIDLPRGAYVPEFKIQPANLSTDPARTEPLQDPLDQAASAGAHASVDPLPHSHAFEEVPLIPESAADLAKKPEPSLARKGLTLVLVIVLLLGAIMAIFGRWKLGRERAGPDIWSSFQRANVPVLICIDTHDIQATNPEAPPDRQNFVDLILRKQIIALDDAAVLSSMAGVLGKKNIPFRLASAAQTSLTELRRQPVVLIGAIDNKWTLRLTQNLRYRIEVANPPGSGSGKEPVARIVDSEHPENDQWKVDLGVPFSAWRRDFAVIARLDDTTSGVPVVIEAGLGEDGSIAASELITSGAIEAQLMGEPSCRGKSNFEAVIGTDIIDTRPGPPHILRLNCW